MITFIISLIPRTQNPAKAYCSYHVTLQQDFVC